MQPTLRDRVSMAAKALFSSQPVEDVGGAVMQLVEGQGRRAADRGTRRMLEAYSELPWLRGVVHRVAEDVSAVRWQVFAVREERGGRIVRNRRAQRAGYRERKMVLRQLAENEELEEILEHPFRELMDRADPGRLGKTITGKMRRKLLVEHLELTGDAFWLLERNEAGAPNLAWPLPPHWVRELPSPDDLNFHVELGSSRFEVPVSEVYWVSDLDPENPYGRGAGTAQALADELETDEYAAKTAKQSFLNRGRPDFIASWGGKVGAEGQGAPSKQELRRAQAEWMNRHRGFWRAFKPHFTNRQVKIHELSQSFEQLQLKELREWERDIIRQVFGVPPEIMGHTEDSNRATSHNARMIYARQTLVPRLELMRETLQDLSEREFDQRIVIDYVSPVPEDREFQKEVISEVPWAFKADEVREVADFGALEDDAGQIHMIPVNVTPARRPDMGAMGGGGASSVAGALPSGNGRPPRLKQGDDPQGLDNPFWRQLHRLADRMEPEFRETFLEAVEEARGEVDLDEIARLLRGGQAEAVVSALGLDRIEDVLDAEDGLPRLYESLIDASGSRAAEDLEEAAAAQVDFEVSSPLVQSWIQEARFDLVQGITDESRAAIRQAVQRVLDEGVPPAEASKLLRSEIGLTTRQAEAVNNFRARLVEDGIDADEVERRVQRFANAKLRQRSRIVAQTETMRAANAGHQLTWREADRQGAIDGNKWQQVWIVTPDDRLDVAVCEPMEGQRVGLNDTFTTGAGGEVPGPPAHPLCRCAVALTRKESGDED